MLCTQSAEQLFFELFFRIFIDQEVEESFLASKRYEEK